MSGNDSLDGQFIFRENEFEEETFHAAGFVAKYRRVNSLESLRDQLRQYSESLKLQLYTIINRDYKDFITIATKLDGVDERVEHLRKPLTDIRLDLAALYDGLASSMQTIQDKLRHREEVVTKRRILEATLSCMEKLDTAEEVVILGLNANTAAQGTLAASIGSALRGGGGGSGARRMRRRDLISSIAKTHGMATYGGITRDTFDCAELERAAFAVAHALSCLGTLAAARASAATMTSSSSSNVHAVLPLGQQKALEQRANRLVDQLVQRIRARLTAIFATALSAATASLPKGKKSGGSGNGDGGQNDDDEADDDDAVGDDDGDDNEVDKVTSTASTAEKNKSSGSGSGAIDDQQKDSNNEQFPSRAFAHCLRALAALGKGEVAESVVAETVTAPLAKQLLTQGRVDGSGGRGSFSGLHAALSSLANQIRSVLKSPLEVCDATFPTVAAGAAAISTAAVVSIVDGDSSAAKSAKNDGGKDHLTSVPQQQPPSSAPMDLLVNGVWLPTAALLKEKFPGMFFVGIASILARCYLAVDNFVGILEDEKEVVKEDGLAGVRVISTGVKARNRLRGHAAVKAFHDNWKLDLYLQLRTQEIFGRLDASCQAAYTHGLASDVHATVYKALYHPGVATAGGALSVPPTTATATTTAATATVTTSTLSEEDWMQLKDRIFISSVPQLKLRYPLLQAFAVEVATALHPAVALRALSSRFFSLSLRLLIRLEAQVALLAETPTPSFPKAQLIAMLQLQQQQQQLVGGDGSKHTTITATPQKDRNKAAATTTIASSSPMPPPSSSGLTTATTTAAAVTLDDLVYLSIDLHTLSSWISGPFCALAVRALHGIDSRNGNDDNGSDSTDTTANTTTAIAIRERGSSVSSTNTLTVTDTDGGAAVAVVVKIVQHQAARMAATMSAVWVRTCSLLAVECKKSLAGVKGVTAKYRMTNKPPPDSPSAYVDTALQPFRSFVAKHGSAISEFAPPGSWEILVVEDVCLGFLQQVQTLMETVRQMDSALQRRSKLRASAAAKDGALMTDSEKISLQLYLDVQAFGAAIVALDLGVTDPMRDSRVSSYERLYSEVSSAEKLLPTTATTSHLVLGSGRVGVLNGHPPTSGGTSADSGDGEGGGSTYAHPPEGQQYQQQRDSD